MKPSGKIDWDRVKARLAEHEVLLAQSEQVDASHRDKAFRERAERYATRARNRTTDSSQPVLVWRLAGEQFGLELDRVAEVFPRMTITPLPGADSHILGTANLKGNVRTVVDLRQLLNLPAEEFDGGYIVLVREKRASVGLWIESLEGVHMLNLDELKPVVDSDIEHSTRFSKGITSGRLVILDVEALVSHLLQPNFAASAAE